MGPGSCPRMLWFIGAMLVALILVNVFRPPSFSWGPSVDPVDGGLIVNSQHLRGVACPDRRRRRGRGRAGLDSFTLGFLGGPFGPGPSWTRGRRGRGADPPGVPGHPSRTIFATRGPGRDSFPGLLRLTFRAGRGLRAALPAMPVMVIAERGLRHRTADRGAVGSSSPSLPEVGPAVAAPRPRRLGVGRAWFCAGVRALPGGPLALARNCRESPDVESAHL